MESHKIHVPNHQPVIIHIDQLYLLWFLTLLYPVNLIIIHHGYYIYIYIYGCGSKPGCSGKHHEYVDYPHGIAGFRLSRCENATNESIELHT